jgi:hypothetical protein
MAPPRLSLASQQGHVEVAQALLAAKADVNADPSLAQTQTPARASALPSDAELDALVAARNWGGLSTALSQAADGEPLMRKLNWLHSRIPAGGPSLLGFTAVRDMWKVGVNVKQPDPNKDFRITAGMLALYTEAPPDWTPAFLSPEKYKPIQDKARADMKSKLSQLVH